MNKDETLRLALEALEVANSLVDGYYIPRGKAWLPEIEEAITAIKAALEAKDEPVVWNGGVPAMLPKQKEGETFIVSFEPKLEAKDEPVAWMRTSGTGSPVVTEALLAEMPEMRWNFQQPLYTTPPQRTWVGLTRDEILEARWHNKSSYKFARVLETKLKERNT